MSVKSCCSGNGAGDMPPPPPQPFNPPQAMNAGLYPLTQGKYSQGEYTVAARLQKDEFIEWIKRGEFRNFERDRFMIHNASRNATYAFFLPYHPTKLAMKRSMVNSRFHLLKRIEVWLYCLLGTCARRGFVGSCLLHDKGIPTPRPLAYWTFRHGWKKWFIAGNYFLYEYQNGESIGTIRGRAARDDQYGDQLSCRMFAFIKQVHIAGLRHGDPYGVNFLVSAPQETESLPDMELASLYLIDADETRCVYIRIPAVKHFFDFEDLAKAMPQGYAAAAAVSPLRVYLGREPTDYDLWLLRFWHGGGIRIRRRLRMLIRKPYEPRKRLRRQIRQ